MRQNKGYEILRPKTHDEWLSLRRSGIGSSEVGTLLGVNPYDTPYQLWRRKRGEEAPIEENFLMKAGHYIEPAVAQIFADETGAKIQKNSATDFIVRDIGMPFMQVSPDRYYRDGKGLHILECKTTQMQVSEDNIPKYWYIQLQYQMGVNRVDSGALAWLISGRSFGYREIRFDAELFEYIKERVREFWLINVQGGEEPACTSVRDLEAKFRTAEGDLTADNDLEGLIAQLRDKKAENEHLKGEIEALEDKVKIAMGDKERLLASDNTCLATWKFSKPSEKFDIEKFKTENDAMYKRYIKETKGTRRFCLR